MAWKNSFEDREQVFAYIVPIAIETFLINRDRLPMGEGAKSFPPCRAPPKRLREGGGGNRKGGINLIEMNKFDTIILKYKIAVGTPG